MKIYLIISTFASLVLLFVLTHALSCEMGETIKRVRGHKLRNYKGPHFKEDRFMVFVISAVSALVANSIFSAMVLLYGIIVGNIVIF